MLSRRYFGPGQGARQGRGTRRLEARESRPPAPAPCVFRPEAVLLSLEAAMLHESHAKCLGAVLPKLSALHELQCVGKRQELHNPVTAYLTWDLAPSPTSTTFPTASLLAPPP